MAPAWSYKHFPACRSCHIIQRIPAHPPPSHSQQSALNVGCLHQRLCFSLCPKGRLWRRKRRKYWFIRASAISMSLPAGGGEWEPLVQQIVLLASVAAAYGAGLAQAWTQPAVPALSQSQAGRSWRPWWQKQSSVKDIPQKQPARPFVQNPRRKSASVSVFPERIWGNLHDKLRLSRLTDDEDRGLEKGIVYGRTEGTLVPGPELSLQGLAADPRRQLLETVHLHLREQIEVLPDASSSLDQEAWTSLCSKTLTKVLDETCIRWPAPSEPNTPSSSEPQASWPQSLDPEKTHLHSSLIYHLRFRKASPQSCMSLAALNRSAPQILEDLVVSLAEGVAAGYLSSSSGALGVLSLIDLDMRFVHPALQSTRALERFRNEVALRGLLHRNITSVSAMFEDCYEIWTIEQLPAKEPTPKRRHPRGTGPDGGERGGELGLVKQKVPARRVKELRALTGWRHSYSIFLELYDLAMPLLNTLLGKVGSAISFLLVTLIGRSLGLVYKGIRQSLTRSS